MCVVVNILHQQEVLVEYFRYALKIILVTTHNLRLHCEYIIYINLKTYTRSWNFFLWVKLFNFTREYNFTFSIFSSRIIHELNTLNSKFQQKSTLLKYDLQNKYI
jgi:hypothetical protein